MAKKSKKKIDWLAYYFKFLEEGEPNQEYFCKTYKLKETTWRSAKSRLLSKYSKEDLESLYKKHKAKEYADKTRPEQADLEDVQKATDDQSKDQNLEYKNTQLTLNEPPELNQDSYDFEQISSALREEIQRYIDEGLLSLEEVQFCNHYVGCNDPVDAYQKTTGCTRIEAQKVAYRLANKKEIKEFIYFLTSLNSYSSLLNQDQILKEIRQLTAFDPTILYKTDEHGHLLSELRPVHEIPESARKMIKSIHIRQGSRSFNNGGAEDIYELKVETHSNHKFYEKLLDVAPINKSVSGIIDELADKAGLSTIDHMKYYEKAGQRIPGWLVNKFKQELSSKDEDSLKNIDINELSDKLDGISATRKEEHVKEELEFYMQRKQDLEKEIYSKE